MNSEQWTVNSDSTLGFMRNAIISEILVEILCPVVGSYSIGHRMIYVAYTVLPKLLLSFCWGIDMEIETVSCRFLYLLGENKNAV